MNKLSFATFALLYSSQFAEAVKVQHKNKQAHAPTVDDAPNSEMLLQIPDVKLAKFPPNHVQVTETQFIQTEAQVSFSPGSCWAGIERWESSSNS